MNQLQKEEMKFINYSNVKVVNDVMRLEPIRKERYRLACQPEEFLK